MNTGTELGQYFCANTQFKKFNGVNPPVLIPKWLWRKRNLVLTLSSLTALKSNIPTGLLHG